MKREQRSAVRATWQSLEEVLNSVRKDVAACYSGRFTIAHDLTEIVP